MKDELERTRGLALARGVRSGPVRGGARLRGTRCPRARRLGRARGRGRPPRRSRGRRRPRTREARRHRRGDRDHGHRHARSARALREPGPDGRRAVARMVAPTVQLAGESTVGSGVLLRPPPRRDPTRFRTCCSPHGTWSATSRPRRPMRTARPDRPAGRGRPPRSTSRRRSWLTTCRSTPRSSCWTPTSVSNTERSCRAAPDFALLACSIRSWPWAARSATTRSRPRSPLGPPPPRRRRASGDLGAHLHRQLGRRHLQPRDARARRDLLEDAPTERSARRSSPTWGSSRRSRSSTTGSTAPARPA